MNAGRELDTLIAKRVMGCRVKKNRDGTYDLVVPGGVDQIDFVKPDAPWTAVPAYSTNIAAAWQVVEKLNRTVEVVSLTVTVDGCSCRVLLPENDAPVRIFADTAPLAICLAALAVVGVTAAEV